MWISQTVFVMVLWAACFPLIVLGLPDTPHILFAALRALLAGAVLLLVGWVLRRPLPRGRKNWLWLVGIGFGATTLGFLGMFHASAVISPGLATVITNAQPILAAVIGYLLLGERLDGYGKAGLLIGFSGIFLIAWPGINLGGLDYAMGLVYLLLSAVGISISNVLIRGVAGTMDAIMAMAVQLLIGAIPLLLAAVLLEDIGAVSWTGSFVFSLLGLSLLGTALAYWLWCRVLETTELYRANVFSYLVPGLGLAQGFFFYDEQISLMVLLGVLLILAAMWLVNGKATAK